MQSGPPDEHGGQSQDPQPYRSKIPFVIPQVLKPISSKRIAAVGWYAHASVQLYSIFVGALVGLPLGDAVGVLVGSSVGSVVGVVVGTPVGT